MESFIHVLIFIPFLGFVLSLLPNSGNEKTISSIAVATLALHVTTTAVFVVVWLWNNHVNINVVDFTVYHSVNYSFFIDFYFDKISAVYVMVGGFLGMLVTIYSSKYMHRESGFKRYFNTILFFYGGYNIAVMAGNFETLFIGWEILGICSFLLIAFYRMRYIPVKNAIKVFSIYRIGDVGMLLAMWACHHLWHENITFEKLNNFQLVHHQLQSHTYVGVIISLMIILAASAKSAQLPFSSWLPRAMEGPTPSSAIFYGSLSVHIGAFLLMRTYPFWEHQVSVRWLIGVIGVGTALFTTLMARVQPTVKGQIAYSSSAQIGLIFLEIACGLEWLALIHFAGNAFLRTYQLLVSPSVVTYLIREQFYNFIPALNPTSSGVFSRLKTGLYLMSVREFHLDNLVFNLFYRPLKKLRLPLMFLNNRNVLWVLIPIYIFGLSLSVEGIYLSEQLKNYLAIIVAIIAFLLVARAYNERNSAKFTWLLLIASHFFVDLAITLNDHFNAKEAMVYLNGVALSGLIGYYCLRQIEISGRSVKLNRFNGIVSSHRTLGVLFLLSTLGLAGFPITTTFFGEDLILTHVHENQVVLAVFLAITFIISGISIVRIYARIFLGYTEVNFLKSSDITI